MPRLIAHSHLAAVVVPVTDPEEPVRPVRQHLHDIAPDAGRVSRAAVTCEVHLDADGVVRDLLQDVPRRVKHPVDNALRYHALAQPVTLPEEGTFLAGCPDLLEALLCQHRVIGACPVHEAAVLDLEDIFYHRILRRRRVAVRYMPSVLRRIRTAQALLYHVEVQQIDLAKIDGPQRHAGDALMAVYFAAALPVDLAHLAARQGDQQMRALVIV